MGDDSRLIVFAGPPCSGKSTLAEVIAARQGLPHLEMDRTRVRILPGAPHTREDRAAAYRAMHFAAELLVSHGVSVILDAPYGHPEDRLEVEEIARRTGRPLFLIECRIEPETAVARFRERPRGPRLDLTEERVEQLVREYPYSGAGLRLDAGDIPSACFGFIEQYLCSGEPVPPGRWSAAAL